MMNGLFRVKKVCLFFIAQNNKKKTSKNTTLKFMRKILTATIFLKIKI